MGVAYNQSKSNIASRQRWQKFRIQVISRLVNCNLGLISVTSVGEFYAFHPSLRITYSWWIFSRAIVRQPLFPWKWTIPAHTCGPYSNHTVWKLIWKTSSVSGPLTTSRMPNSLLASIQLYTVDKDRIARSRSCRPPIDNCNVKVYWGYVSAILHGYSLPETASSDNKLNGSTSK
jgi:hypothetical protein